MLQPFSRTRAFRSALLPPGLLPDWPALNRLSYFLIEQAVWQPWRIVINQWRQKQLGLTAAPLFGIADRLYAPNALLLTAASPRVVPPPPDWPPTHHLTGFWFLDPPPAWQPPSDLVDFLQAGPSPVYVGFGSPGPRQQASAAEIILQSARSTGMRMATALPAAAFPPDALGKQIFPLEDMPHSWLFPRCAALVHHGGAGTTAAGFRAGVPAVVIPRATDQFFWGQRVHTLGCGPRPLAQHTLNAENLAHALQQTLTDATMAGRARSLGNLICEEKGVENAADRLAKALG
jgi:UDP:flavonoid glycosyltransferase YjiC (YdhE family)